MDGRKDYTLTRGGLAGTPSNLGNLSSDRWLNSQKSAEVIVLFQAQDGRGRTEQLRRTNR
ncbi:hypothetical protein EW027_17200 [Aeribacillus pallidus]|nr:hypothetical protein EW027_17200 [Aeribacillus pallidus]